MIGTSSYAKALWPGVNTWFGMSYGEHPEEWREIFTSYSSDKNFEEDVGAYGFPLAVVKPEGDSISFADAAQGFVKRYVHITYALGFKISREAIEDNLYMQLTEQRTKALGLSMRQTREVLCANVINRAFNSSYTGADGKELCSTAHLKMKGGTYSNKMATDADLSEASLEQSIIDIMGAVNDSNLKIALMPRKLLIPKELVFEAERILKSALTPSTALNAINALKSKGVLPEGYAVNHYLTDANAFFILTNCPEGLKRFEKRALAVENDTPDFATENMSFKASFRESLGWTDPRCIYGSQGSN